MVTASGFSHIERLSPSGATEQLRGTSNGVREEPRIHTKGHEFTEKFACTFDLNRRSGLLRILVARRGLIVQTERPSQDDRSPRNKA